MEIKKKKCRVCEKEYTPFRTTQNTCSNKCFQVKQKKVTELKETRLKENGTQKKKDLFELARITFNAYIRERDKGKDCICCGGPLGTDFQAGHFYNGFTKSSVVFNEDNVHGQSKKCNEFLSGNLTSYAVHLEKFIGPDRFNILREEAYKEKRYTTEELQRIIEHYRKQTRILKNA